MDSTLTPDQFVWHPQPAAQAMVDELLARFLVQHPFARGLADQMSCDAGVRLVDCIDFIAVAENEVSSEWVTKLDETGFETREESYIHPGGIFPVIRVMDGPLRVGVRVDRIDDFAATHHLDVAFHGRPGGRLRTLATPNADNSAELWAVERHGWVGFDDPADCHEDVHSAARWLERFRVRQRQGEQADVFKATLQLVEEAKRDLPGDWVCDLFFQAERDFWMRRNRAAKLQYDRQCRVGIGWANHDHHTYRSSRVTYAGLIAILEALGLHCRERFYPGPDAGWGAQVLENPRTRITVFADVDMTSEELQTDFPHLGLGPADALGTVGLWCGLHGDSMAAAGMHHLECTFDFAGLAEQLEQQGGIKMMTPFSSYDHLKQQFTEGERWAVEPSRVDALLAHGFISADQAERFKRDGAIGSHMENLERNDGFKGFNQGGITQIIHETDPRRQTAAAH